MGLVSAFATCVDGSNISVLAAGLDDNPGRGNFRCIQAWQGDRYEAFPGRR